MYQSDTIAAIATAVGNSGIGIIRISGPEAIEKVDELFVSVSDHFKLKDAPSHTIHYGHICFDEKIIDEVLVSVMKGPKSFTAEDTVEINCHGGAFVMQQILEAVISVGVKMAEPGEFTKRAFLNGRIDLSQAEAVIDVINAKNQFALKNSIGQLSGAITKEIRSMREEILHEIAFIESALDDPEHISLDGYPEKLFQITSSLREKMEKILENADQGSILKEGINTLILGKPNAGKSTLLNQMAGKEKAIVTEIAGTTRDILEEKIQMKGLTLNLIDTAGIHETEDKIEKIGVDRALSKIDDADLVLYVMDSTSEMDEEDQKILEKIRHKKTILLCNKVDEILSDYKIDLPEKYADFPVVSISARFGNGMEQLYDTIQNLFFHGEISYNDEVYLTNLRQKEAILDSLNSIKLVIQSIEDMMPEDFFSIDLMKVYTSLGKIIGEEVEDDLINHIFSRFCMGK